MTFTSAGAQTAAPSGRIQVKKSPGDAYDAALAAMKAAAFDILGEKRPETINYAFAKQSLWTTGGARVTYTGTLTVAKADGGSTIQMASAVNWGSAVPMFIAYAVFAVFMSFIVVYAVPLALIGAGISAWVLASQTPEEAARAILGQVSTAP